MKNKFSLSNPLPTLIQQEQVGNYLVTNVAKLFPSGMRIRVSVDIPIGGPKSQRFPSLQELTLLGCSQKWAALFTGMSQSYASKGLKQ